MDETKKVCELHADKYNVNEDINGGTCWGNYLAMGRWDRFPCGICIKWCQYIEKLKEPCHQRSPFYGPHDGAIALASLGSASAVQMRIANQGDESGRAILEMIMHQNTRRL